MDLWKLLFYYLTFRWLFGSSAASSPAAFGDEPVCDDRNRNGICDEEENNGFAESAAIASAHQTDPLAIPANPDLSPPYPSSDSVNPHIHDDTAPETEPPEYWYGDDEVEEDDDFEEYGDNDEETYEEEEEEEDVDVDVDNDDAAYDSLGFYDSDEDDSSWSDSFGDEE